MNQLEGYHFSGASILEARPTVHAGECQMDPRAVLRILRAKQHWLHRNPCHTYHFHVICLTLLSYRGLRSGFVFIWYWFVMRAESHNQLLYRGTQFDINGASEQHCILWGSESVEDAQVRCFLNGIYVRNMQIWKVLRPSLQRHLAVLAELLWGIRLCAWKGGIKVLGFVK
jgi:hypothetical protein